MTPSVKPDESLRVRRELIEALYRQTAPAQTLLGATPSIVLFAVLQWMHAPGPKVVAWAAGHLALVTVAFAHEVLYRRRPLEQREPEAWARRFTVFLVCAGLAWGVGGAMFFDPAAPTMVALTTTFLAGVSAVSVVAFSWLLPTFIAFQLVSALPICAVLLASGRAEYRVMALGTALYSVLMILTARGLHRLLVRSAELRFRNEDLAASLTLEKDRVEAAYHAKTRFLAAASHDLRQPMHALGLFVELLAGRAADPEQRVFVERIQASSRALEGLLNSLLDVSRIDSDALKPRRTHFELGPLLEQLELEARPLAQRKGLQLTVARAATVVVSDSELLGRVLRNLLSNALRYTDAGAVELTVQPSANGGVIVCVADTGRGVPPAEQEKVFEEFYQAGNPQRDREQGLGLGLSIVRGLCRLLDHRLELISQPRRERGTEVRVELPRGDAALAARALLPPPEPIGSLTGRCVLVIDDERDIRAGMAALLSSWQCEPLCAGSLEEAAALLDARPPPDAVVCDFRLPSNTTGLTVLEALERRVGARLPAVIVTGDTSPEQIRLLKASGRALLFKPVVPGKLRAALTAALTATP